MHFVMVRHCEDCVPDVPKEIKPVLKSKIDNKEYRIKIEGMLPYSIRGSFLINHDLTEKHVKWYMDKEEFLNKLWELCEEYCESDKYENTAIYNTFFNKDETDVVTVSVSLVNMMDWFFEKKIK